jgi:hypothetical protein
MTTFQGGMTPAQFYTGLNSLGTYVNVLSYGAVGDDNTDNTTALQAALDAVSVTGGTIFIPAGIFKTHKLTIYKNVNIKGEGCWVSSLKSISAEPMLEYLPDVYDIPYNISDITLEGDNTGSIALHTKKLNSFYFYQVVIRRFTVEGIRLWAGLIGTFQSCIFWDCVIGVNAYENSASAATNLIAFKNCLFYENTSWGVKWTGGRMVRMCDCNFERCGTNDDITTGCISYKNGGNGSLNVTNIGLYLDHLWFEANEGILINLEEPTINERIESIIQHCMLSYQTSTYEIKVVGANTLNRVIIRSSSFQGAASFLIDGANAEIINDQSFVNGTITKSNSGLYKDTIRHDGSIGLFTDDAPADGTNPSGYAKIYIDGVAHTVKLYQ